MSIFKANRLVSNLKNIKDFNSTQSGSYINRGWNNKKNKFGELNKKD